MLYLPSKHPVHAYKAAIRAAFTAAVGEWPTITGAVHLSVYLQFEMPKSWSEKKRNQLKGVKHTGKPDLDNVLKAVCDALTDCKVWQDDRQVASIFIAKRWSERGKTTIRIERTEEDT
jgi:Holliday junction resolvase RusA-like endonuclease